MLIILKFQLNSPIIWNHFKKSGKGNMSGKDKNSGKDNKSGKFNINIISMLRFYIYYFNKR